MKTILVLCVVAALYHAHCHGFQPPLSSRLPTIFFRLDKATEPRKFLGIFSLETLHTPAAKTNTSLHAAKIPVFALGFVPKMLSMLATPVVAFFRIFTKDMGSLTPRQAAWWTATVAGAYGLGRMPPFWRRYSNVMDIPRSSYGKTMWGRAVRVSDGDTIRFLHQPTPWHSGGLKKGQKSSELALPVRICTIDTPETPKFGKPGQPFGLEAKEALKALLEGKRIGMRIIQTDQYARAVAQIFCPPAVPLLGRPTMVDEFMLRKGLAEVYTGGGAVYGPKGKDAYLEMQENAKKDKLGIWSQGKQRESAAEYKRRTSNS